MRIGSVSALVIGTLVFGSSSFARTSDVEPSFYTSPKQDYRTADKLTKEHETTAIESDLEEADAIAYKALENDARKEAKALRNQIAKLEAKIISTKEGAAKAREKAELAQKKTDLVRSDFKFLQHKLKNAQKLERDAQVAKALEEKKLLNAQAESDMATKETQVAEAATKLAQDERAQIMERAAAVRAVIAAAKQRKQEQIERARQMTEENKKLNSTVSKAEVRFGVRVPASN